MTELDTDQRFQKSWTRQPQVFEDPAFVSSSSKCVRTHKRPYRAVTCPRMSERPYSVSRGAALGVAVSSAVLGPLLDNYHSQFGILTYTAPLELHLRLSDYAIGNFTTAPFTPPLFVIAGLIISSGTLLINHYFAGRHERSAGVMPMPKALATIAAFSAIYYLSASLPHTELRTLTGPLLALLAGLEWHVLDGSIGGLVMGLLTGVGGPCVEVALINLGGLYSYSDPEFCGIPLFIAAVYFAGGPAVGNLARALEGGINNSADVS